eukprot:TRINITY_DN12176_c0_g1_i2.p1 TRINITY_DN12176_c0_g1~~TRINITY_DN12176_c0_g1_i2.p1  ORF type:complete len:322 (+),score=31.57 TRINITY_DN12176_c0_g1_i2:692-1657(+)
MPRAPGRAGSVSAADTTQDRYEVIDVSGSGVYGTVYRAVDKFTQEPVALKRVQVDAEAGEGTEGVPTHVLREASLLRSLRHPNIVRIHDVIYTDVDYTLVFEYVEQDLYRLLKSFRKMGEQMPFQQVRSYAKDLFSGIFHCHSRLVVHRDIKPQNVLVGPDGLKLCDFGLARSFQVPLRPYTHEVVTLWYRAPEILLGATRYGPEIDLWSLGCVLAEMAAGYPVFAGDSEIGTLFKIFLLLGTPDEQVWPRLSELAHWSGMFPKWKPDVDALYRARPELLGAGQELLDGCLCLNPQRRWCARKAMRHSFSAPEAPPPAECQ